MEHHRVVCALPARFPEEARSERRTFQLTPYQGHGTTLGTAPVTATHYDHTLVEAGSSLLYLR